jgi:hypothetical protein
VSGQSGRRRGERCWIAQARHRRERQERDRRIDALAVEVLVAIGEPSAYAWWLALRIAVLPFMDESS